MAITPRHTANPDALRLTAGAGDSRPQGRPLSVAANGSRARALCEALNLLPVGQIEGWWCAARFRDDYRDGAHWVSSEAVGVDPDYYGAPEWDDARGRWIPRKAPLPPAVLEEFRRNQADGSLPGSASHETPSGLRVLFPLDRAATDPEALHLASRGACAVVDAWIKAHGLAAREEHGVAAHGLKVDVPASTDRARFWYAPRARVKGVERGATVKAHSDRVFTLDGLAAELNVEPSRRSAENGAPEATAARARTEFEAAVAAFNTAHAEDWPRSSGECPACGHRDCFGRLDGDPARWACFSSSHGADSNGCGLEGEKCWHGDALDLAAHAARGTRADLLRRGGYLSGAASRGDEGSVGSVGSVVRGPFSWPTLMPFGLERAPEPFPLDALPPAMARWAEAEARMLQCPVDLPALLCRGVGALAVAKKRVVRVNERWLEPLNQYLAAGLLSGESKSPAFEAAIAPLRRWERETIRRLRPAYEKAQREEAARRGRIRHLEKQAARLPGGAERDEIVSEIESLAEEAMNAPRIRLPRLFCEDITPEKLAEELARHGGRMGMLSDEAGPFEMMAGRYANSPRLEVYLKAYSGSLLLVDRKGLPGMPVPSLRIECPILTTVLTVQPSVIEGLAAKKEMRTRGLLARFTYCLPASRVGRRSPQAPPVPASVSEEYGALVTLLLDIEAPENEEGEYVPLPIGLSPDAEAQLVALKSALEPRLAQGCDLAPMQDWVNKHWGRVLRTAGLLHLCGLAKGQQTGETLITGGQMERAIRIGNYDLAHAGRAFASMAEPEDVADARAILGWINRKGFTQFSERDAHRGLEHRFPLIEGLRRGLRVLRERGYVRERQPEEQRGTKGGRPPSPVFEVHPDVRENGSHETQPTQPTEPDTRRESGQEG